MIATATALKLLESHADWWSLAGLGTPVGEDTVNWLAPPPSVASAAEAQRKIAPASLDQRPSAPSPAPAAPTPQKPMAPIIMPTTWDEFQTWLATGTDVPGTQWHHSRILPSGAQAAAAMILSLTPEIGDHDSGALHSGAEGKLLDAMLRAIGLTRGDCYLASLALTRPPGGRLKSSDLDALTPLLWHHLRLAQPRRLVILGMDLARILASTDLASARGQLLFINHDGVNVEAVAIQHPLLLLDRPARKAAAWDSLKRLAQG